MNTIHMWNFFQSLWSVIIDNIYTWIPTMTIGLGFILLWLVIDIYRYIKYTLAYRRLNSHPEHRDTNHKNIKNILDDLKMYPDICEELIHDLFFNKLRLEDMNFDDVCSSIFEMIGEYEQYRDTVKKIVKRFQLLKRNKGKEIFTSKLKHHRIRHNKHDIIAWFTIFPVYLITRCIKFVVHLYMKILGYSCYRFSNGLNIWYNSYDKKKGIPLVFFHASVGGVSVQAASLKYLLTNHNIIIPEIPGVSFIDTYDLPPSISDIIENVHEFVLHHYINNKSNYYTDYYVDNAKLKINLMGHSLGCTICSSYINKYPQYVGSLFCVEGQIFFPRALRISEDFVSKMEDIPAEDLITVPLFHRDLYVQYFIIKRLTLDATMIFDMSEESCKNIKIHMYHIKNDRKLLIRPQLEYATRKNIKLTYHLFDGDYSHGSFAFNKKIRDYVMKNIQQIYDDNDYLQYDILTKKQ